MSEFFKMVDPGFADYADPGQIKVVPEWATVNDGSDILQIRTDNMGKLYVASPTGDVFVQFDADSREDIHAAVRWIAKYLENGIEEEK